MRLGCNDAIPLMSKRLTDPATMVREATVAAFCCMDADEVARVLIALVEDPAFPRRTALTIVCANPHVAHLDFILACLSDPSAAVRRAAAEALARQPTVDVVGTIEPLLRDPDVDVRRAIVKILGDCGANASDSSWPARPRPTRRLCWTPSRRWESWAIRRWFHS